MFLSTTEIGYKADAGKSDLAKGLLQAALNPNLFNLKTDFGTKLIPLATTAQLFKFPGFKDLFSYKLAVAFPSELAPYIKTADFYSLAVSFFCSRAG